MNFVINIRKIFYLPIILLFFPAFALKIPGTNFIYLYIHFVIYILLGYLLLTRPVKFISKIADVIKATPVKYLFIAMIMMILNSIILFLLGKLSLYVLLVYIFGNIIFKIIPILMYFMYIIDSIIPFKKFLKTFIFLFWINLIMGFVSYIGQFYEIDFINGFFNFFANIRFITSGLLGRDSSFSSNYQAFGLPRLDNLFEEPAFYALFLFLFLPFVYNFRKMNFHYVKNKYFNLIISKTLLPFTLINLFLTFSPINQIFALFLTIIIYFKDIVRFIKKYFIFLLVIISLAIWVIFTKDFSDTYLSRVINVMLNVKSLKDFAIIEPSLATRIIGALNSACIYFQHPISGVGMGNLPYAAYNQYLQSPFPLTEEIINKTAVYVANGKPVAKIMGGFFTTILAENGTLISLIWLYFIYKLYKISSVIQKRSCCNNDYFYYLFSHSLKNTIFAIFIVFFYDLSYTSLTFLIIVILGITGIYSYKKNILKSNE